jgi:hypothetical protein
MSIKHISDEDIQSYMDGIDMENRAFIEEHLNSCTLCHNTLKAYQEVYQGISNAEIKELSPEFSDRIMADLERKMENKSQLKETLSLIGLFLVGSTVSFYFVNPFSSLPNLFKALFSTTIQYIEELLPTFNGYSSIIIMVVLILIIVEVLDKKVVKTKT